MAAASDLCPLWYLRTFGPGFYVVGTENTSSVDRGFASHFLFVNFPNLLYYCVHFWGRVMADRLARTWSSWNPFLFSFFLLRCYIACVDLRNLCSIYDFPLYMCSISINLTQLFFCLRPLACRRPTSRFSSSSPSSVKLKNSKNWLTTWNFYEIQSWSACQINYTQYLNAASEAIFGP